MNIYSEKFFEQKFSDKVSKKAYLDACKWLAQNVYSKPVSEYVTVKITKVEPTRKNPKTTFVVELYASINENEVKDNFCNKCKQMHTIFYCIDKPECEKCKAFIYKKNLYDRIKGIKEFCEEIIGWE